MARVEIPAQRTTTHRNLWHQGEYAYTKVHGRVRVGRIDFDHVYAFQVDAAGDRISTRQLKVDKIDLQSDEPGKIKPLWVNKEGKPVEIFIPESTLELLKTEHEAPDCLFVDGTNPDRPSNPRKSPAPYSTEWIVTAGYSELKWLDKTLERLAEKYAVAEERHGITVARNEVHFGFVLSLIGETDKPEDDEPAQH